jgi:hypothetical protein
MDRRLLFPAIAATAWAQQTAPATAEAEKALRARASQFYQLEVDKKFRQAEALVAEDTKDYFYDNGKPDIKDFRFDKAEISEDGTQAKLTVTVTAVMKIPAIGVQEFKVVIPATWKIEKGEWVWYMEQEGTMDTPFGKIKVQRNEGNEMPKPPGMPDMSKMDALVSIDRTSVQLVPGNAKPETVTILNGMPGPISVQVVGDRPQGLIVQIDNSQPGKGEKAVISLSAATNAKPGGTVRISAGPLQEFVVRIATR